MPDLGESGGEVVGAAAQLISAALQTIGLYGQGAVLEHFSTALGSFGALMYVIAGIGALFSVALFGNYRKGLYLLIGPPLFWWMLTSTVPARVTEICVGHRCLDDSGSEILDFMNLFLGEIDPDHIPNVSWFYAQWDRIVSSVSQNVVSVIIDEENKRDLIATAKQRMLPNVMVARAVEKPFVELIAMGFGDHCANLSNLAHQIGLIESDIAAKEEYVATLSKPLPDGETRTPEQEEENNRLLDSATAQISSLSFKLLQTQWEYNNPSNGIDAKQMKLSPDVVAFVNGLNADPDPSGSPVVIDENTLVSCGEIWQYTRTACHREAERLLTPTEEQLADPLIPWDEVSEEVKAALGENPDNPGRATQLVAAHILKNTIASNQHSAMVSQLSQRRPLEQWQANALYSNIANHEARGGKYMLVHFAGAVPYIQGLLLYLLTVIFPFFTVLLIMPSQAPSFFVWLALWAWVKSWDIGFAFVKFIEDFLWLYTNKGLGSPEYENFDWNNPASVLSAINSYDPLASLNTFYTVIAILTLSVPALTAHMILGATDLFEAFKKSITEPVENFGRRVKSSSKNLGRSRIITEIHRRKNSAANRAAENVGRNQNNLRMNDKYNSKLSEMGDGALGRRMNAEASQEFFREHFNNKSIRELRQVSGMHSGRTMTYSAGAAQNQIAGMLAKHNEQYIGRENGAGNHGWFNTNTKGAPTSTNMTLKSGAESIFGDGAGGTGPDGAGGD